MKLLKLRLAGIEPISERELERQYSDMLDEVYGEVTVAGYQYATSDVLVRVDPTAEGRHIKRVFICIN